MGLRHLRHFAKVASLADDESSGRPIERRPQFPLLHFGPRLEVNRSLDQFVCRFQVLPHEEAGSDQLLADAGKTLHPGVFGKFARRIVTGQDSDQQVADRVAIFGSVQAAE